MQEQEKEQVFKLVVINAGTSDPSSTSLLASRITANVTDLIGSDRLHARAIDLKPLANDIASALVTGLLTRELEDAQTILHEADAIIASTPIYKAGASALFTGFFQVLDTDVLIGKPAILAATGLSGRHSLVVDSEIRSLFTYLRTMVTPTSIYATPDDFSSSELQGRIERAAGELQLLLTSNFAVRVRENIWQGYQHSYGSAAGTETGIDLDSDLMRLATGGK